MMKLIVAIVHHTEGEDVLHALTEAGFRVTRIASSGGFLRRGNATLLVGAEAGLVPSALQIIREYSTPPVDPGLKRAAVFVLKVDSYEEI
jgi:uncharacterized protein YaaQ